MTKNNFNFTWTNYNNEISNLFLANSYLPARSLSENDVILLFVPFYKFEACKVFPVPHCLLDQCFIRTSKITIYFIWYNSVIPNSFLPRRSSSLHPCVFCHNIFPFQIEIWFELGIFSSRDKINLNANN